MLHCDPAKVTDVLSVVEPYVRIVPAHDMQPGSTSAPAVDTRPPGVSVRSVVRARQLTAAGSWRYRATAVFVAVSGEGVLADRRLDAPVQRLVLAILDPLTFVVPPGGMEQPSPIAGIVSGVSDAVSMCAAMAAPELAPASALREYPAAVQSGQALGRYAAHGSRLGERLFEVQGLILGLSSRWFRSVQEESQQAAGPAITANRPTVN